MRGVSPSRKPMRQPAVLAEFSEADLELLLELLSVLQEAPRATSLHCRQGPKVLREIEVPVWIVITGIDCCPQGIEGVGVCVQRGCPAPTARHALTACEDEAVA